MNSQDKVDLSTELVNHAPIVEGHPMSAVHRMRRVETGSSTLVAMCAGPNQAFPTVPRVMHDSFVPVTCRMCLRLDEHFTPKDGRATLDELMPELRFADRIVWSDMVERAYWKPVSSLEAAIIRGRVVITSLRALYPGDADVHIMRESVSPERGAHSRLCWHPGSDSDEPEVASETNPLLAANCRECCTYAQARRRYLAVHPPKPVVASSPVASSRTIKRDQVRAALSALDLDPSRTPTSIDFMGESIIAFYAAGEPVHIAVTDPVADGLYEVTSVGEGREHTVIVRYRDDRPSAPIRGEITSRRPITVDELVVSN